MQRSSEGETLYRVAADVFAQRCHPIYNGVSLTRGGAVWQLVGLITRRSKVQILPPQPTKGLQANACEPFVRLVGHVSAHASRFRQCRPDAALPSAPTIRSPSHRPSSSESRRWRGSSAATSGHPRKRSKAGTSSVRRSVDCGGDRDRLTSPSFLPDKGTIRCRSL